MTRFRFAIGVEYDGAAFCGWQTQPSRCGVQDELESALSHVAGHSVETVCAGRTDAGVHGLGQVVHFETDAVRPESAWVRGVNACLKPSMAVIWAHPVSESFHARYSARGRRYRYVLLNHAVRPAAALGRVGWFHLPLDMELMRSAARLLVGEHDFSAFRSSECQARSPVRTLHAIDIAQHGPYIFFDFSANAFLQHMVRNLVGTLIYVGKGKRPPQWVAELLRSRDRTRTAPTMDAAGLYLADVKYDAEWGLPRSARVAHGPFLAMTDA